MNQRYVIILKFVLVFAIILWADSNTPNGFLWNKIISLNNSSSSSSTNSSSNSSCSYSGAHSFAKERAGNALSTLKDINSLNMGRVRGMGYDSDYGFIVEGYNRYGGYSFITILISCSNGNYAVDLVDTSN